MVLTCAPIDTSPEQVQASNPSVTYKYNSDQELLDASRNAQVYSMNSGSQQMISNMATNANGTKTVTFQCSPRQGNGPV